MKIESYTVETIAPHKRPAIWGMSGNGIYPICNLQKPAWMTEEQFDRVVKSIRIDAPTDILRNPNEKT